MCYSVSLRKKEKKIEERFSAEMQVPLLYEPYYHQSGFHRGNLFIVPQDSPNEIVPAMWGLIPQHEALDIEGFRKKYNTLNAKSETVFNSRTYRDSIKEKRCLILADGFFEPHKYNDSSYPYFCHLKDDSLFAFAGIYTQLDDQLFSCSILTQKANDFFAEIHNEKKRMPLVLDSDFEWEWLRDDLSAEKVKSLIKVGFTKDEFDAYTVSKDLYKPKHQRNTAASLARVDYPELGSQKSLFD